MTEVDGGVVAAWHFYPLDPVRLAMRDVVGQEVSPAKHVEAVDARVAGVCVFGARGDEAAKALDEDECRLSPSASMSRFTCGRSRSSVVRSGCTRPSYSKTFTDTAFCRSKRPMSPSETGNAMPAMLSSGSKSA